MAEVFASPTLLGKRAHISHESCDGSPHFPPTCKRRRSFDPLQPSSGQEAPWAVQGFEPMGQGWARGTDTQGGDGFGGAMSMAVADRPTGGFSVLGKRGLGSPEAREQTDRHTQAEIAAKDADIQRLRDCIMEKDRALRGVVEENHKLKQACAQAEATIGGLVNDSKILKRGINVQQQKCAKLEEEVGQLRTFASKAAEYIQKLEQEKRSLCFRMMQQSSGSCHDFIHPEGPPDVF